MSLMFNPETGDFAPAAAGATGGAAPKAKKPRAKRAGGSFYDSMPMRPVPNVWSELDALTKRKSAAAAAAGAAKAGGGARPRGKKPQATWTKAQIVAAHKKAALHGGAWWDFLDPNKNGVGAAFNTAKAGVEHAANDARAGIEDAANETRAGVEKAANETRAQVVDPNSVLRSKVIPIASKVLGYVPGPIGEVAQGIGALNTIAGRAQQAYGIAKNLAGGAAPRVKRQVSPKMAERNAIVKAFKAQYGCTLGEASRAVKEHGLWQK